MTRIGILSDTHGFLHPKLFDFFASCHQLWHAGDFGNRETADTLASFKPLRGVYGNIDGHDLRTLFQKEQLFIVEERKILMTHIGGTPNRYNAEAKNRILSEKPDIFVCGHSHICKVQFDQTHQLLYINPGAAGKYGFHHKITMIRFSIDGKEMKDMEVMELSKH